MNLLEIHGRSTPFGGASVHTTMLVHHLSKTEGNATLVFQKGNQVFRDVPFPDNVHMHEFNLSSLMLLPLNIWRLNRIVKQNKIDLIHSHHRNADFVTGILKLLDRKLKIVTTIHGRLNVGKHERKLKYVLLRRLTQKLYEKVFDRVVFISNYTMQINEEYFRKAKQKTVIYNGSARLEASASPAQTRRELGIGKNDFVVTLLGAMEGVKRPHLLLEIGALLKNHPDICFLFVGDGEQIPALRKRAKEERIHALFPGWRKDVGDIIQASNVIVSTAFHEGFGRTLTEAMMLSKPVIAFNTAGPAEIIGNEQWGYLIEDDDIELFARAIYLIYANKTLEKKFGENAAQAAKEKFSNDVFCANYQKAFQECLREAEAC